MCFHRRILLSILCSSVAFAGSQFATPRPRPKERTSKPSVEISSKAPSENPAPIAEETPRAEELATPAPTTERKTHVKRRATPAPQLPAAELPVASVMSISAAKAVAVRTPMPDYPYQAKRAHVTGNGVCVMIVDTATGNVTSVVMEQSTGNGILDKVTTDAFRKWRFKPGTVSRIRVPISYE